MNNKTRSSLIMQILTGAAFAVAAPVAGYAQAAPQASMAAPVSPATAEETAIKLPEFNVIGHPVDPYNAAEAVSAARTSSKILDTPMTVDVITPAMIQDVNPNTLLDVTNYFAGVSPGRASGSTGLNDRQTFRGFESFSRTVDDFAGFLLPYGSAPDDNFDPVFLDHAELIMGPDTILSPTGTPGGTVNAFTKSPLFTRGTDVSGEVGNYNANRLTVDSTGPLGDGKHMAYRVIAAYQDTRGFVPGTSITYAGSAQFTYKFSDTAKLTLKYFGSQQRQGGVECLANLDGEEVYTPDTVRGATVSDTPQPGFQYCGWNGDATWSYHTIRDNTAEAELTAALGERVNMRLAAQVYYTAMNRLVCFPSPSIAETWDPNTGQEISVGQINPASVPETASLQHLMSRQIQAQNDYAGNFNVGGVSLQPVAGWAYQQGSVPVNWDIRDKALPNCNLAVGYYSPPQPLNSQYTTVAANIPEDGATMQAYGYLRAGFLDDRVFATVGAGRTWAHVNDYTVPYVLAGGGENAGTVGPWVDSTFSNTHNALAPSVQPWHDTYIAGILGKVLPNVSVYYNYSTNAALAAETPLWQAGVQNEFGFKSNFFNNRISINADHFEITQSNVSATNPLFNTGQSTIPLLYANLASHGYEVNIVGGVTKDLSVIVSYTDQKLRDNSGRRRRNIPDNMANLLVDYHFNEGALKNSDIFVGVLHQGDVAGENVTGYTSLGAPELPGYYIAAFTVVNAGAGYQLGNYKFNLNVNNVTNKQFWWQTNGRTSLQPYPGINVTLTVTVHI